ncbi:hypothetical protein TWF696_006845 [Orbilia brochopaga]|uniref:chitin synthase n=1 Tax=Orbilia brochopaga TaxID=3140254 RepID=A0AAV9UQ41_9PEZI
MAHASRHSTYSNAGTLSTTPQASGTVNTSTLIASLHNAFQTGTSFAIDAGTSVVVTSALAASGSTGTMNTGVGSAGADTIDVSLAMRAWEHARRRAEDQCVVIASLAPSLTTGALSPLLASFPRQPTILINTLNTIRPFLNALSPMAPQTPLHNGLVVTHHISLDGDPVSCSIALTPEGIDTARGLTEIPAQVGYRGFDVFYYLLSSASSPQEREYLSLESPDKYKLLRRSGTYFPPAWHPTADDAAGAEDFRQGLREIGIKGSLLRGVLSVLAGLLKLGNATSVLTSDEEVEEICEDVAGLLGVSPQVLIELGPEDREKFIGTAYEALVHWVINKANASMEAQFNAKKESTGGSNNGDTVAISLVEIPAEAQAKALSMRIVFDDEMGINAEMKDDGLDVTPVNSAVLREMKQAIQDFEGDMLRKREKEYEKDRRDGLIEKVGREVEAEGFLKQILLPEENGLKFEKLDIMSVLSTSRTWFHLSVAPSDGQTAAAPNDRSMSLTAQAGWSAATVSRQIRAWRLVEWANRRNKHLDFTADFDFDEIYQRYHTLGCLSGRDGVETWVIEKSWSNGEAVVGKERVWLSETAWWQVESMLDMQPGMGMGVGMMGAGPFAETPGAFNALSRNNSGFFPPMGAGGVLARGESRDNLLNSSASQLDVTPTTGLINRPMSMAPPRAVGAAVDEKGLDDVYNPEILKDEELAKKTKVEKAPRTLGRRAWVAFVWALTFLIPSFLLRYIGRMRRPDVRFAWREKLVLFFLVMLANAGLTFYIIGLADIICPEMKVTWNQKEVSYHTDDNDFWVSVNGSVYDISKFWRIDHSDTDTPVLSSTMKEIAGFDLTPYFQPPLTVACPEVVTDESVYLRPNDTNTIQYPTVEHLIGNRQPDSRSALHDMNWYKARFLPKLKDYYKGRVVIDKNEVARQGLRDSRMWFIIENHVYDLTNYFYSQKLIGDRYFSFFNETFTDMVQSNPGGDITTLFNEGLPPNRRKNYKNCLDNAFHLAELDVRDSARCKAQGYILLSFAIILCAVIGIKFIAALQLGGKKSPAMQDKFVICQVPAYTEGEDSLRKAIDSLTALNYENKRKLLFIICDGMVIGGGNDQPTPQLVLDILGVDPNVNPPALPFKSVGEGSKQLNYGKVYSGLYEYEGRVVPYIVVVKVGKESETTKPGNRGKRDSQVLLMDFLNKVHHRTPMSPLQLELFHQINNVIGVDPELYEYMLMVDADTCVREDSLNRLIAACANNAKIAGICGETSLENEERSWWTMIQVYEYYISHHLSKSFESLFGSVTCLPGCFCMYRLRTADKGRPLIISDKVIDEYSDGNVDTLHKKNLLALGEDRYLTTLMTKHFPHMSFKFIPDAYALTAAPETWSVLLSQRRRWINSTIHNLVELMWLKDMCGFCLFSMRFVVFIDLAGTVLLPSTCAYIVYLIYQAVNPQGAFPRISLIMIAAVYGLQALIFLIKRQWQHIGWMIIYILAYPIYSFVLPVYSFWKQDDFSWGSTRIVVGEKGDKKIVAVEEEAFDPASIPLQTWDDYAAQHNLPGRRVATHVEKYYDEAGAAGYEMDDMQSVYSSIKPASTLHFGGNPYLAPHSHSPSPLGRQSVRQSSQSVYRAPSPSRAMSAVGDYWQDGAAGGMPRESNLLSPAASPGPAYAMGRGPGAMSGYAGSRPASSVLDFQRGLQGPDDATIIAVVRDCLNAVDLDSVTKKQVRALVEQRLQTELVGERRKFLDAQIDVQLAQM